MTSTECSRRSGKSPRASHSSLCRPSANRQFNQPTYKQRRQHQQRRQRASHRASLFAVRTKWSQRLLHYVKSTGSNPNQRCLPCMDPDICSAPPLIVVFNKLIRMMMIVENNKLGCDYHADVGWQSSNTIGPEHHMIAEGHRAAVL